MVILLPRRCRMFAASTHKYTLLPWQIWLRCRARANSGDVRRSRRIGSGWCKREGGNGTPCVYYSRSSERRGDTRPGGLMGENPICIRVYIFFTIANANTTRVSVKKETQDIVIISIEWKRNKSEISINEKKGRSSFSSFTLALVCYTTTTTKERLMKGN